MFVTSLPTVTEAGCTGGYGGLEDLQGGVFGGLADAWEEAGWVGFVCNEEDGRACSA